MAISFDKRKTQLICERLISDEQSKLPANSKYKFETLCLSSVYFQDRSAILASPPSPSLLRSEGEGGDEIIALLS